MITCPYNKQKENKRLTELTREAVNILAPFFQVDMHTHNYPTSYKISNQSRNKYVSVNNKFHFTISILTS